MKILSCSSSFIDVWPTYRPSDPDNIIFVVFTASSSEQIAKLPQSLATVNVVYRDINTYSKEENEIRKTERFPVSENDLSEMVSLFNQFKGSKNTFITSSPRCKIQSINKFVSNQHWSVDRWWNVDEKIELGIEKEEEVLDAIGGRSCIMYS